VNTYVLNVVQSFHICEYTKLVDVQNAENLYPVNQKIAYHAIPNMGAEHATNKSKSL
jgi:hypothetical protein